MIITTMRSSVDREGWSHLTIEGFSSREEIVDVYGKYRSNIEVSVVNKERNDEVDALGYLLEAIRPHKDASPIKKVIFNNPATIILWKDGTKTVVKCQKGDTYDKEKGFYMCVAKKALGNKGNFNNEFKRWLE